jgi:hypothetical protein
LHVGDGTTRFFSTGLGSPCGPLSRRRFHKTSFTYTSTGLISERNLTAVSRLA